ncbi:MAG: ABC transporter substrate-binding protein [Bacteroidales bacterium]|nr:ABC transporter substrate-binding protein [Bacteroidales bacterium]
MKQKNKFRNLKLIIIVFILFGCNKANNKTDKNIVDEHRSTIDTIKYAKSFEIESFDNYKIVTVRNPWQGVENIEYKYLLIEKGRAVPKNIDAKIIRLPIKRIICLSTTHVALIDELGKVDNIIGISGAKYISNAIIRKKIEDNEVFDIGYKSSLNYELITVLKPDLVITYGVTGEIAGYNHKLQELGITTVINAEYLESSPLGKTEWIKFMAAFLNCDDLANEKFTEIEAKYNELKNKAKNLSKHPSVLSSLPWKDVWYVPGGDSFQAHLIEDAGGKYLWKNNNSRESIPLSIETVFSKAQNADIWINTGSANSKKQILGIDERIKIFKSFKQSKIFNNNNKLNPNGGNDYWEKGIVQPHIILKDMIKIFHPELFPDYDLHYYKQLK